MFVSRIWNAILIYLYPVKLSDRRIVLMIMISLLATYAVPAEMLVYCTCLVIACLLVSKSVLSERPNDFLAGDQTFSGRLYPRESETREVRSLDGLWNFRLSPPDPEYGFRNEWFKQDLSKTGPVINMPVPSSYNDITQDASVRDHVGIVWYDRRFYAPDSWRRYEQLVWLRFGSVHYAAKVWINGIPVMQHEIGHLPFEQDITRYLKYGESNLVTVACDNMLLNDTVPQGNVDKYGGQIYQSYTFDFFNYAGIHRPVHLYTTPTMFISDIHVHTDVQGDTGLIHYSISCSGFIPPSQQLSYQVEVLEKSGEVIVEQDSNGTGLIEIPNARLWWPYLMDPDFGYLYTLRVSMIVNNVVDVYSLRVGIRTISWSNTTVLLNNKPLYMRGFGMHEDSDIRGKGLDLALYMKNYNLIHWVGANTYRTSHYPYAEEQYDLADELGIMVIDECPSVDTDLFSRPLLKKHMESLTQLINRDKNHPSVIMWSIANEPRTQKIASGKYFGLVAEHVRSLDTSRPITIALAQSYEVDQAGQYLDVISFNRYNAWYHAPGDLKSITKNVINEARSWHKKYKKPVLMAEYGADTMEGLHLYPAYIWSEEYQVELMSQHFKAFDTLRQENFFIGEFIWNFADFKTAQTYTRVGGNKKGIFTRQRQPKASAHHLRARYHELAHALDGAILPHDLRSYTSNGKSTELTKYEL